ncbi:PadR family transcriptional regulator [Metabacillus fastidiosus]|uniref:PadR family transcriptional regulator n=1 Tax=Metabacillus fastidiosus TaxID=1458 RepID=UPI002E1DB808|nr:PadR family transcriptional regulator [Metabacillus fastidiosus]
MNIQFKKGALELCVLALTVKKDRYGYELVEEISKRFEISEGTIYPLLRRLTKEGLFSTYLMESTEGPPRKYYKLTDKGEELKNSLVSEWKQFTKGVNEMIKEGEIGG